MWNVYGAASLHVLVCVSSGSSDERARVTSVAGEVELTRLVDLCAVQLGMPIEYDSSTLRGSVTLRVEDGLTDDQLWRVTQQALVMHGYTTVRGYQPAIMSIVRIADAQAFSPIIRAEQVPTAYRGYVTLVAQIEHQPTKAVIDAIKNVLSKAGGTALDLGSGGLILIADLEPKVNDAVELIAMLDVPGPQPVIEVVPTQFLPALAIAPLVTAASSARDAMLAQPFRGKIIPSSEGDAVVLVCPPGELEYWRSLVAQLDQRQPVVTRTYIPRYFAVSEVARLVEEAVRGSTRAPSNAGRVVSDGWRVVVDDLTATLIITATAAQHEQIDGLIRRLNSIPADVRRPVRIFPVRNRSVIEIAEVLTQLLQAGVLATHAEDALNAAEGSEPRARSVERIPARAAPVEESGIARAQTSLESGPATAGEVTKVASPEPAVTPAQHGSVVSRPRGSITQWPLTLTADVGTNSLIAVGEVRLLIQLESLVEQLDVRQPQVMIEVMVVNLSQAETFDLGVEFKKLEISGSTTINLSSLFGLGTPATGIPTSIPGGRGFSAVVLSPGDFSVVLRALQTINRGRTLSFPKVLVNNNQKARLDSVVQQPFVSTNASDTVATTSFGGTDNAGTLITIRPQIAEGDHLILEYTLTLSSFLGEAADPTIPPPKQSNTLSSVVTIPDGYTVIVGGLEIANEADGVTQIPILGNMPILGEAFKSRSKSVNKSRFYVFIRSEVLRHPGFEDLKYMSAPGMAAADLDDGWPQVKPRIIR